MNDLAGLGGTTLAPNSARFLLISSSFKPPSVDDDKIEQKILKLIVILGYVIHRGKMLSNSGL